MGTRFRNSMEGALGKLLGLHPSFWAENRGEDLTDAVRAIADIEGISDLGLPFAFSDLRVYEMKVPLFPLLLKPPRSHPFVKYLDDDEDYAPILVADGSQLGPEALYVVVSLETIDDVYEWLRNQETPEVFLKIRRDDGRFLMSCKLKALLGGV